MRIYFKRSAKRLARIRSVITDLMQALCEENMAAARYFPLDEQLLGNDRDRKVPDDDPRWQQWRDRDREFRLASARTAVHFNRLGTLLDPDEFSCGFENATDPDFNEDEASKEFVKWRKALEAEDRDFWVDRDEYWREVRK